MPTASAATATARSPAVTSSAPARIAAQNAAARASPAPVASSTSTAGAALRGHRPLAAGADHHRYHAGRLGAANRSDVDAARRELGHQPLAGVVLADTADQPGWLAECRRPGTEVRGLAAAADPDGGGRVVVGAEPPVGDDRDVEHEVPDRHHHREVSLA